MPGRLDDMTELIERLPPRAARRAAERGPRPGAVLAIVLTGQVMAVLDATIVNVAVPSMHAGLHASGAGLQLIVAGYTIAYAVLLVTGARLGDILGHRRMFRAGVLLFTLASLGCGLAPWAVLTRAIVLRDPYVDALSYLQLRALSALRADQAPEDRESDERLLLLTVSGIAAGLQNTG